MNSEKFSWDGFDVVGDVNELNEILNTTGFINVDKEDIKNVLSLKNTNYIVSACGNKLNETFEEVLNKLPIMSNKIGNCIVCIICGNQQPKINELSELATDIIGISATDVKWGLYKGEKLEKSFKIIIVASKRRKILHIFLTATRFKDSGLKQIIGKMSNDVSEARFYIFNTQGEIFNLGFKQAALGLQLRTPVKIIEVTKVFDPPKISEDDIIINGIEKDKSILPLKGGYIPLNKWINEHTVPISKL